MGQFLMFVSLLALTGIAWESGGVAPVRWATLRGRFRGD